MTTPADPRGPGPDADPLDELASAIVDGEADAVEAGRVGEPEVAARVEAFRAVAELVATPVPPLADADRERLLAAALAEADDDTVVTVQPTARLRRRPPVWLPAAAAVAVAVAGFGLRVAALGSGTDDRDEAATADADATLEAEAFDDAAGGAGGSVGEGEATTAAEAPAPGGGSAADSAVAVEDLGELDERALEVELGRRSAATPATTTASNGGEVAEEGGEGGAARFGVVCEEQFGTSVEAVFTARLDGVPVIVAVFRAPDGSVSYSALEQETCTEVAGGQL